MHLRSIFHVYQARGCGVVNFQKLFTQLWQKEGRRVRGVPKEGRERSGSASISSKMAEEQIRMKWKEYLEDRLEARLLQESLKMEERLRQERMLILELVEQKIKRAMRKFRMEEMNAIIEEAMEEDREERGARKWLREQLEEGGVKAKGWDLEVEAGDVKRKQRREQNAAEEGEEIQQVMWRREEGAPLQESRAKKNTGRGTRMSVKEALVKMLEKKTKEQRREERPELERVDELMEEEIEANGLEKSG